MKHNGDYIEFGRASYIIRQVLAGKKWHPKSEVVSELSLLISPQRAFRKRENHLQIVNRRYKTHREKAESSVSHAVKVGKRMIASVWIENMRHRGELETKGKFGKMYVRLL
jgi:hypothetical protein